MCFLITSLSSAMVIKSVIAARTIKMTSPCKLLVINYIIFRGLILYRQFKRYDQPRGRRMMTSNERTFHVKCRVLIPIDTKQTQQKQ